jgi:hypothetical protein
LLIVGSLVFPACGRACLVRSRFPAAVYFRAVIKSAYDKRIKIIQDIGSTQEHGQIKPAAAPRERR